MENRPASRSPLADEPVALGPRSLRLFRVLLWLQVIATVANTSYNNITHPISTPFVALIFLPICFLSLWLLRQNRVSLALQVFLYGMGASVILIAIIVAGVRSPVVGSFPIIVLLAALLISPRSALVIAIVSGVVVAGLALGETAGVLHYPVMRPALNTAFTHIIFLVTASVIGISVALERRESDLALRELNRTLEEKVAERTAEVKAQAAQLDDLNHTLEHRIEEQVQQIESLGQLKRFFSPQLAEVIVAGGREALKTHRSEITVVFIDLRGFTAFTDRAEPEEVMEMLNAFHGMMGNIVTEHGGTLERFAGDSMMIFFNDPVPVEHHTEKAAHMALVMQEAFVHLSAEWTQRGYELGLGCGIALGHATLGEIGFEGRWDYAAIGSVTNRAARLCAEAASGQVLVDRKVMDKIGSVVKGIPVGSLTLKGMTHPVPAFLLTEPPTAG